LRSIVEYLREEGWEVAAILGHSKGAHTVLRYAWTFDDVLKVISLSGRFDFSNQPKTRFSQEQMDDMEQKG
jgi:S-formylglutathione hydrolase FrmB